MNNKYGKEGDAYDCVNNVLIALLLEKLVISQIINNKKEDYNYEQQIRIK